MSDTVIVAIIGGTAGIITALTTGIVKLYELFKSSKEKSLEDRVKPIIVEALEPTNRRLDAMQLDVTRMRLMSLIRNEPSDAENILIIAKIYFENMGGNSEAYSKIEQLCHFFHRQPTLLLRLEDRTDSILPILRKYLI